MLSRLALHALLAWTVVDIALCKHRPLWLIAVALLLAMLSGADLAWAWHCHRYEMLLGRLRAMNSRTAQAIQALHRERLREPSRN